MKKKLTLICICLIVLSVIVGLRTEAKATSTGTQNFANVVLFAYFADDETGAEFFENNSQKIMEMYDGAQGQSFTNYMKAISYDQFQVKNVFPQYEDGTIQAYKLSMNMVEAQSKDVDAQIIQELTENISTLSGTMLDYNNDGILDNVTVILRGKTDDNAATVSVPTLHSHKSDYPGSVQWSGKYIVNYNMLSTYSLLESVLSSEAGLIAHEFLHSLGYPDLYTNDGSYPVYTWDIMALNSRYVQYPLAYTRMYFTNWLTIDTITGSQTNLTLDVQSNANGNQAYIIESPLNSQEVFVVEFRKKKEYNDGELAAYDKDSLDMKIGGSGIIVYRVDKTVEGLTNRKSEDKPGIYVFRPQSGQDGYSESASICVQSAYLSEESRRTSIGSSDMSKGLTDGALTFSDGSNSGIVISNVSSSSGDQMTFDVSIPEASQFDLWSDTGFEDISSSSLANKNIAIESLNGTLYTAAFSDGKIQMYRFENEKWVSVGAAISESSVYDMTLFVHENEIFLSYAKNGQTLCVKKYSGGTWINIAEKDNINVPYDVESIDGELYFAYTVNNIKETTTGTQFSVNAVLAKVKNGEFQEIGTYFSEEKSLCGQPKICVYNGKIYASVRNANGNVIEVYCYDKSTFKKVSEDNYQANNYDMVCKNNKLYVLLGGSNMRMAIYDGSSWKSGNAADITSSETRLIELHGKLYVLANGNTGTENTKVYQYDERKDTFEQEGGNVDSPAQGMSVASDGNTLFVAYLRTLDEKMVIKSKNINGGESNSGEENSDKDNSDQGNTDKGDSDQGNANKEDSDKNNTNSGDSVHSSTSSSKITLPKTSIIKLKKGKKSFIVKWKKKKQITGYQIQYSTDKKFKKNKKTVTVKRKAILKKITKLKSRRKYYVRIRTYKTVKTKEKTKKIYSKWCVAKAVRTK